jgi:rfaE bifunctional protein nucleotidyltransferase chain/domain
MNRPEASIRDKIIVDNKISQVIHEIKLSNKTIALCHGVFDLLHPGHLRHLAKAKEMADVVIVSITSDRYVNKGPGRPVFPENLRAETLANISSVDFVVITTHETAEEIIEVVKPNFYVKGNDYAVETSDVTGNISKEKRCVEEHGGKLVTTNEIVFSSSQLINQFFSINSREVDDWLKSIKSKFSLEEILIWVEKISSLKVTVIGETILDVYTNCDVLGKSTKDPVLCLNRGTSTTYAGGTLAMGANCNGLGLRTKIVTAFNSEDQNNPVLKKIRDSGINLFSVNTSPNPTIRKERIIDNRTSARVIEIYEMIDDKPQVSQEEEFVKLVKNNVKDSDVVIVADYGHGLITNKVIEELKTIRKYIAVNTQINAGNRGFNSVSKFFRADLITLNSFETEFELRRKNISLAQFISQTMEILQAEKIIITNGANGLDIYSSNYGHEHSPALAPFVKDRVGAGDVVLCITALLAAVNAPDEIIGFYGVVLGAWAVSFIGNEKNINKIDLIKIVTALLK